MIDFYSLVLEAVSDPSIFKLYYDDESDPTLTNLRTYLKNQFAIESKWLDSTSIFPLLVTVASRGGVESLVRYAEYFPLFDFCWYVAQSRSSDRLSAVLDTTGTSREVFSIKNIEDLAKNFVDFSKNNNTSNDPIFNYVPASAAGTKQLPVLQRKLSSNIIGKLSLSTYDTKSIKEAFYGLIEARKKLRTVVLKKDPPTSNKYIDGIIADPKLYTNTKQVPAELSSLYNINNVSTIIEIAQLMHDFFNSEVARFESKLNFASKTVKPKLLTQFDDFILNKPLINGPDPNDPNKRIRGFRFVWMESMSDVYSPASPAVGGYTIKNIKGMNTPTSKELIQELEQFANYISEAEPTDWNAVASGVNKISSALGGNFKI